LFACDLAWQLDRLFGGKALALSFATEQLARSVDAHQDPCGLLEGIAPSDLEAGQLCVLLAGEVFPILCNDRIM